MEVIPALPLERLAQEHGGGLLDALTPEGASPDQLPAPEFVAASRFDFPKSRAHFLQHADEVGGANGAKRIQSALYAISGPATRGYTGGELSPEDDYLDAEALKAAEQYRDDPVLGPFYRWIVECEQKDRQWYRDDSTASMAELEES